MTTKSLLYLVILFSLGPLAFADQNGAAILIPRENAAPDAPPTTSVNSANPRPDSTIERKVVAQVLNRILPLELPDYEEEAKLAEAKRLLLTNSSNDEEGAKIVLPKKTNRCYLSVTELKKIFFYSDNSPIKDPFHKEFKFGQDCHVDGKVDFIAGVFRVDLALKEMQGYFRIRFFADISAVPAPEEKRAKRFIIKIRDGELFHAEREFEPDMEFLADYEVVATRAARAFAPGTGTLYVKTFRRKKYDQIFPLRLR